MDAVIFTFRIVVQKVILNQSICVSFNIVLFFTGMSVLEGKGDISKELREKFGATYLVRLIGTDNLLLAGNQFCDWYTHRQG